MRRPHYFLFSFLGLSFLILTISVSAQNTGVNPIQLQPIITPQQFQPILLSSSSKGPQSTSTPTTFSPNNPGTLQVPSSSDRSTVPTGVPLDQQSPLSSSEATREPTAESSSLSTPTAQDEGTVQTSRPRRTPPPRYPWEASSSLRSVTASSPSPPSSSLLSSKQSEPIRSSSQSKQAASSEAPLIITAPMETGSVIVSRPFDRMRFGYSVPIIDPERIATPLTLRGFRFWWFNLLLAVLSTMIFASTRAVLRANVATAPPGILRFLRRLPLSVAVFLVLIMLKSLLLPTASAQGALSTQPFVAWLVPLYSIAFFVVAGATNFVCNNFIGAEAATLERFFTPGHRANEKSRWNRSRLIILLFFFLYAAIGAHINVSFSLVPTLQPGIALIALFTIIVAAYAKDGMRFALAHARRFSPWLEANALGILLALLSIWLTRSLGLSPGYLFGIPAGVFIVHHAYARREGLFEWAGLLSMLACALVAWFVLPLFSHLQVLSDFLRLLIVILLEACFFESLPTPYTAGGSLIRWKKWIWAVQMTLTVFLVLQLLWNPGSTIGSLRISPPGLTYVLLLGVYILFVLGLMTVCKLSRRAT